MHINQAFLHRQFKDGASHLYDASDFCTNRNRELRYCAFQTHKSGIYLFFNNRNKAESVRTSGAAVAFTSATAKMLA